MAMDAFIGLAGLQNMNEIEEAYGSVKGGYETEPVEWISTEQHGMVEHRKTTPPI